MSKNNQQPRMVLERKNFKLYKAKKQWVTACATVLVTLGATAFVNASANADPNSTLTEPVTKEAVATVQSGNARQDKATTTVNQTDPNSAPVSQNAGKPVSADSLTTQHDGQSSNQADPSTVTTNKSAEEDIKNSQEDNANKADKNQVTQDTPTDSVKKAVDSENTKHGDTEQVTNDKDSAKTTVTDDTAATKTKVAVDKESTSSDNSVNQPVSSDKDKSKQDSTTLAINQNGKSSNTQQLAASKAAANIAPAPYTFDNGATVVAGSNMAEIDPADLLENGAALEKAGAKITWNVLPENPTQEGSKNGTEYSGSVTVTYADGTKVNVDVSFIAEPQVQLAPNKFYYVSHVGDNVDPITTPDANGNTIFNFDDPNHSVTSGRSIGVIGPNIDVKLLTPLDTSTIGIHWAEFQFTDQNVWTNANTGEPFPIPGASYTVKLPYVVNTIPLRTDIPVDSAGNPVINAQLSDNGQPAFMNTNSVGQIIDPNTNQGVNTGTLGQYFYQDYALAYALGIATNVTDWTPTAAEGTKTNLFKFTLQNLPDAPAQTVQVNYVATPKLDTIYIYNQGKAGYRVNRIANQNEVNKQITSGSEKDAIDINVGDQVYHPTSLQSSDADMDGNIFSGKYKGTMTINYSGGYNKAGQPVIFTNNAFIIRVLPVQAISLAS
ncbi:KxYKxGKxW signal peptide domain-containing protein [uncultured Limosilactobacillus sp.]|uniref:KxYKxGKxW signal peptide domain-containing protein n=1 Tax=uncultured Limosilactobacillus sp. TaxID=2837629 RepID=UPI002633BCD6|nr:KxYKxGKxW signal peptide domain-containing protein [uncultured Limosilactobacillus sp.]